MVVVEKKAQTQAVFNEAFVNLLQGRKWADMNAKEQEDLVNALPAPGRAIWDGFHAAMAQNSSIPDAMKEETRQTIHIHIHVARTRRVR